MPRNVALQVIRGQVSNRPTLGDGEFYFATDEFQLYVGLSGDALPVGGTMAVQVQDATTNNKLVVASDGSIATTPGPGAATAALQTTQNTHLANIDTNTPALIGGRLPVDGSAVTQPVSGAVSIGSAVGKTAVLKTGTLTSTAITAGQAILAYTVTAAKTLFLEYLDIAARLTAVSATASVLGTVTILIAGTVVYTCSFVNPTTSDAGSQAVRVSFGEPIPLVAGTLIQFLVTPAAATSMLWMANLAGYEK